MAKAPKPPAEEQNSLAAPNPIYAIRLQAKVVSLDNSYINAVYQETLDVTSSVQAKAYAKSLDVGKTTHSAVLEYYVTFQGTGLPGDITRYSANVFMIQVEPRLVLNVADDDGA